MASFWYNTGLTECMDGTIDIDTDTIKIMLVTSSYSANQDDDVVDAGGANDAVDHEISVTGYTGGYGGAGRKTCTITMQANDTDNRVDIAIADLTWTSLGSGATIAAAILIKENATDDTNTRLIAYFDVSDTATNGGDITLDFNALGSGGNLRIAT